MPKRNNRKKIKSKKSKPIEVSYKRLAVGEIISIALVLITISGFFINMQRNYKQVIKSNQDIKKDIESFEKSLYTIRQDLAVLNSIDIHKKLEDQQKEINDLRIKLADIE